MAPIIARRAHCKDYEAHGTGQVGPRRRTLGQTARCLMIDDVPRSHHRRVRGNGRLRMQRR
jgi:hypothetical protein